MVTMFREMYRPVCFLLVTGGAVLLVGALHPAEASTDEITSRYHECRDWTKERLLDERNRYRGVQYGEDQRSVLGTSETKTSDLVPYLVLNYRALDCRMQMLCESVRMSHGHLRDFVAAPHRPLGCSRLFTARGRWWSPERKDEVFRSEPIAECSYTALTSETGASLMADVLNVGMHCDEWAQQILKEEKQMLKLLVAQDGAHRGIRSVASVFQSMIRDVRQSFLEPLRGMVDLF